MRRYLFIGANDGCKWGGSEPLWSSAAEKLVRLGNEVRVSTKDWGEPVPHIEQLRQAGCQIFHRRPEGFLARQVRKILPRPGLAALHLRSAGRGVDLVVISQGANTDGLHWMEAARADGLKYATIAHGAAVNFWPEDDIAERVARGYEGAAATYFVSQAVLDFTRRQCATPLRNAKLVRNPFNVRYDADPAWPGDPVDELLLACVGRLDVISKAQDLLLQVMALPRWRERNARVSLVGDGPYERGLRRLAKHLSLSNVEFMGRQEDIEEVWSKHHALVLPSRFEGMPLVVVEAMLCGRPCIATDVGGNAELIRDGVNGFLARAAAVEFLDEAMDRCWENRARLREMGEQAKRDVRVFVPADPAEEFATEIERLANAAGP